MSFPLQGSVTTPVLEIGYEAAGEPSAGGVPVILLHGFPYDVRAYDEVADELAASGRYVLAPYLRGYGSTRFREAGTLRSGQQAALGQDLLDFMDTLGIERAVVAGYDWGGRAACVAAALWPERIAGLVTCGGYAIQDIANSAEPTSAEAEQKYWYQYYFHSERGRRGLTRNRDDLCALLWRDWSPKWTGADAAYPATAPSLHNEDFVDVVIHSYRHRYGLVEGDPRYGALEVALAALPNIAVPTVILVSEADGVTGPAGRDDGQHFAGPCEIRSLPDIGHNAPQEAPIAFAEAVIALG
ncbi:alpha/beta fold hydrolase [Kribbella kalugense]|uniref:Pimeloyl-ACP methyl ester carboxylesterase n=1 Tax=Kribbella kalugense TaxID=2512221 RepID=A0A4R7ZX08_9ACTN|nr:alpha/beta hydrolase [Kribbella kalugense]TDW22667.1 pimeloyl-ACP methyl ester carboxylesterase [Kribbella kalugense]